MMESKKVDLKSLFGNQLEDGIKKVKDTEAPDVSGGLPEGINGGIAQIVMVKFDTFKDGELKGKPYFMASAIVKSPEKHNGVKVLGRRTSIGPEPICSTPNRTRKTVEDHIGWVVDQLKLLGVNTKSWKVGQLTINLEAAVATLVKVKPHISFRTWKGKPTDAFPDPRVTHTWEGLADAPELAHPTAQIEDDTDEENEEATPELSVESMSLETLVEHASDDASEYCDAAQFKLKELAIAADIEEETVDNCDDWDDVLELINKAKAKKKPEKKIAKKEEVEEEEEATDESETDEEETENKIPEVEEIYGYVIKDPKTKKSKSVEVEVMKVYMKTETVDIRRVDTKQILKQIKWTDLETQEDPY